MATYLKNRAFGLIAGATPVQPKHFTVSPTYRTSYTQCVASELQVGDRRSCSQARLRICSPKLSPKVCTTA